MWVATPRHGEWVVARIDVQPAPTPRGTSLQPPALAPHEAPQSERQRVVTQFGAGG
jgi:hypothetical protein